VKKIGKKADLRRPFFHEENLIFPGPSIGGFLPKIEITFGIFVPS
jgi:hypothetical protein